MASVGLVLGLLSALAWGFVDVTGALAGRLIGSMRVMAGSQLVGFCILASIGLVAVVVGAPLPTPGSWMAVSAFTGFLAMIAYLAFLTALRIGPISIVSPVVAAYGGLTVVLAVVVRGEQLTSLEVIGALVATIGVMAVGFVVPEGRRLPQVRGRGVLFGLVSMFSFAVLTVIIATPIREVGWLPAMLTSRTVNAGLGLLLLTVTLALRPGWSATFLDGESSGWPRRAVLLILVAGVLDVLGIITFSIALENAPVWIVGLASSLGPVVAVVFAVSVLGERPRPIQWAGLVAIGVGILLVGLP
jgi:drug/metabolite transporter (DMT)-like permease